MSANAVRLTSARANPSGRSERQPSTLYSALERYFEVGNIATIVTLIGAAVPSLQDQARGATRGAPAPEHGGVVGASLSPVANRYGVHDTW